jgi:hypothetical protein
MRALPWFICALLLIGCDDGSGGDDDTDGGTDTDAGDEIDTDSSTWGAAVDEFWGEAPDQETRLEMFDDLWGTFAETYACFDSYDVDWDLQRDQVRPLVEQAESYGRFYGLLRAMIDTLHDPHSPLLSDVVCHVPRWQRPPMFKNMNIIPIVGGCVTLDDEGDLLIYRAGADEDNPLGLAPGDVVVGFDGKTWQENLADLDDWGLPECDEDFAAAPISAARQRAASVPTNAHLFTTIEIRRYGASEVESFDTEEVLENISNYLTCGDYVPVEGLVEPVGDLADLDWNGCNNCVAYGLVPETNIGYVTVFGWYGGALNEFAEAVTALWETDGLIIDQRFNLGGVVPFINYGFPQLFDEDIDPLVRFHERDPDDDSYFALVEDFVIALDADEATYYDHPIAVLTGPKSGSAGDVCPYLMSHHPRARLFGRETNGAFGELAPVWYPYDPFVSDFSAKVTRAQMLSPDGEHLNAWEQTPDEEVWLTKDDAAAGIDTILSAALEWIETENAN